MPVFLTPYLVKQLEVLCVHQLSIVTPDEKVDRIYVWQFLIHLYGKQKKITKSLGLNTKSKKFGRTLSLCGNSNDLIKSSYRGSFQRLILNVN